MKRTVHTLVQGSADWHAYRAKHFNASDCPAMLGVSSYKSRDALLKEKATGITPEIDAHTQRIFNAGHEFEEMARPIACGIIGDDLYPITVSLELDGLNLSASLDGITMDDSTAWEHKTLNQRIEEAVLGGEIPEQYRVQMEMQMLVSGAERCLFMASRGTADTEIHKWYESDPVMRERIIAGWKQFAIDLANYVLPEAEAPKAVAEQVDFLPAINIRADGQIKIIDNLDSFEKKLGFFLSEKLILKPETDIEFATLALQIKALKDAEASLKLAGTSILAQIEAVDIAMRKKDSLQELVRQNRLMAEKIVETEKDRIKRDYLTSASNEWNAVIVGHNEQLWKLAKVQMPAVYVDFQGAIKGLKTVSSLRSKLNDELARGKIEAGATFEKLCLGISLIQQLAGDKLFLFSDLQSIVGNDSEYIAAIVGKRITDYEAAEQARIQAEAKRMADEQIEKDRQAELARAQAAAIEAVKPLQAEITKIEPVAGMNTPQSFSNDDYDHFMLTSENESFEQAFDAVFTEPEPIADMSDFFAGKMAAYAEIANLFFECKKSGRDFENEFAQLYQRNKLPRKAA